MSTTWRRLALAAAAGMASAVGAVADVRLPTDLGADGVQVEFGTPTDWRCRPDGACVTCTNVAAAASGITIRRPARAPLRHDVPAGTALRLCTGPVAVPDAV